MPAGEHRRVVVWIGCGALFMTAAFMGLVWLVVFGPLSGKVPAKAQEAMMAVAVREIGLPEEEIQTVPGVSFDKCVSRLFRAEAQFVNVVAVLDEQGQWTATWHNRRVDYDAYSTEAECLQAYESGVIAAKKRSKG